MFTFEVYLLIIVCQLISAILGGILGAYLYRIYIKHQHYDWFWQQGSQRPGTDANRRTSASPEKLKRAQSLLDSTQIVYLNPTDRQQVAKETHAAGSSTASEMEISNDPFRPKPDDHRLTHLVGRTDFIRVIKQRLAEIRNTESTPCVGLIRIDGFDSLRRDHGYSTATLVTNAIATFLSATTRDNDSVSLYDDATFGLLIASADRAQAIGAGQRLRRTIATYALATCEAQIRFTVSIGMALTEPDDDELIIMERVETALREATFAGGNCVVYIEHGKTEILSATRETMLAE